MTWFRVDDGLPEHRKSIALWKACKSDWKVYAVACWAWRDMGCDCAHWQTHGTFERDRAHRVLRAPEKVVDAALDALVVAGFLTADGDLFTFHDWQEYQPTKDELAARKAAISEVRSVVGKKGGVRSGEVRRGSKGEANPKQTEANGSNAEATENQEGSPVSRFPVPVSDPSSPTPSQQPAPVVSTDAPKADPTMTKDEPTPIPVAPAIDPESTDPTDLLNALAESSGNVFDRWGNAGTDVEVQFQQRLADYGMNVRRVQRLGPILAKHPTTMPKMWVKEGHKIRMALLMGPCTANGKRGGTWLSVAVGILEAAESAEAQRAARSSSPQVAPPPPPFTSAQFAAAKSSPSAPSFLRPVSATHG